MVLELISEALSWHMQGSLHRPCKASTAVLEVCQRTLQKVLHCRYSLCCRTIWFFSISQSSVTGLACCWAGQLYKMRGICCLCITFCVFVLSILTVNATCADCSALTSVMRQDSGLKAKLLLSTEWIKRYSWSFLWQFSDNLLDEMYLWAADFWKMCPIPTLQTLEIC